MKRIALLILTLALNACTTLNVADPSQLMASGSSSPGGVPSSGGGHKLGGVIIPQQLGDFWGNNTAVSPYGLNGSVRWTAAATPVLDQTAPAATVAGSDFVITAQAGGATSGNPGNLVFNIAAPNGGSSEASFKFRRAGSTYFGVAGNPAGPTTQACLWLGVALTLSAASNCAIIADGTSFTYFNTPSNLGFLSTDSNFLLYANTTNVFIFGTAAAAPYYFDSGVTAKMHFGTGATSAAIAPDTAAAAGVPLTVSGGAAGGTNDGGLLSIGGGANAGAGTAYGRALITSPLDPGYLRYSWPSNAGQTLTAAQSANNAVRLFAGTISGAQTLTVSRRAANPGTIWIRNVTGFAITVQWLTGTGVSVANNTSALIGSDGANAEVIMTGT